MNDFSMDMMSNLLGNPHSISMSSQYSTRRIEDTRLRALRLFKASPDDFDLVFVANATAGIKLVIEGFREHETGFWYGYHRDSHTSLVGVREAAKAGCHFFISDEEVEAWIENQDTVSRSQDSSFLGLFAYPAQSNMNGRRLPLSWSGRIRTSKSSQPIYTLLDAAALVSTSPLDLSNIAEAPDFTVLSFYKIFGFPDLGALIVRKASAGVLQKRKYFGGGTVEMLTCGKENWHIQKQSDIHEQLEDGTLPIHSIVALDNALNVHEKLYSSLERIATHTSYLAGQLHDHLVNLRHSNGCQVAKVYNAAASSYHDPRTQGPIIAFNLIDSQDKWISNTEVEKFSGIRNIQLRSGGLCNPGGIACALNLPPWEVRRNFSNGHRCGNEYDIIEGKPTGVLRVSLGAMSNMRDVNDFIAFVEDFFVDCGDAQFTQKIQLTGRPLYVESLTVFPIKSCGGWSVPRNTSWDVRPQGLAWDREWCLIHQGSRKALTQKQFPKMALIQPYLDLDQGFLRVRYHGPLPPKTPIEISVPLSADPSVYQQDHGGSLSCSQACGDRIIAQTYASKDVADFFTNIVETPCILARFPVAVQGPSIRHSKAQTNIIAEPHEPSVKPRSMRLSNESPILTIFRSSLNRLNEQIKAKDGKAAHASVFRANIVVAEDPALPPGSEQPFAEDQWRALRISKDVELDVLGGCRRCQMVCVDQNNAEKNAEPFVTLAKTRRKEGKVYFGVHTALADTQAGHNARIRVGDYVYPMT